MTTLEAASQCLKNAVLFHGLPGQVRIIDLKGTNWCLWRPLMVSPHWWLKIWWRYDGHMKSVFSYHLFSSFKCNNQHPASTGQTFRWGVCVVDSKSLSQVLFGTRALGTNQSWVWSSDIASQGITKIERWIQYRKSAAFESHPLSHKITHCVAKWKRRSSWKIRKDKLSLKLDKRAARSRGPWGPRHILFHLKISQGRPFRNSKQLKSQLRRDVWTQSMWALLLRNSGWDRWEKLRRIWLF